MKKFRLRKWFEYTLVILTFVSMLVMISECEDTLVFIISHLVATMIFVINSTILINYSK